MLNRLLNYSVGISIILTIICALFGLILIAWPTLSLPVLLRIISIFCIAAGAFRMFRYFTSSDALSFFRFEFAGGLFLVLCGLFWLFSTDRILANLPAFLGFCAVLESALGLQSALDGLRERRSLCALHLLLSGAGLVVGVIMLVIPGSSQSSLTALLGIALLLDGADRLIAALQLSRYIGKLRRNAQGGTVVSDPPTDARPLK